MPPHCAFVQAKHLLVQNPKIITKEFIEIPLTNGTADEGAAVFFCVLSQCWVDWLISLTHWWKSVQFISDF